MVKRLKKRALYVAVIIICWLPYIILNYPAIIPVDGYVQWQQAAGETHYSVHHPLIYTFLIQMVYVPIKTAFGSENLGIAVFAWIQCFVCACVFADVVDVFNARMQKVIFLALFSICPIFPLYAITIWKDTLAAAMLVEVFLHIYSLGENKGEKCRNIKFWISFFCVSFLSSSLRPNQMLGLVVMGTLAFLALIFGHGDVIEEKQSLISFIILVLLVVLCFVGFNKISKEITNASETSFSNNVVVFLQQIAAVITEDGKIDDKTAAYLDEILDVDKVPEVYEPFCSDQVKHISNGERIKATALEFFATYLKLLKDNPKIYLHAYINQTGGYWIPFVGDWIPNGQYWVVTLGFYGNEKEYGPFFAPFAHNESVWKGLRTIQKACDIIPYKMGGLGIYTWLLILVGAYCVIRRKFVGHILFPLSNVFVILFSTQVVSEFRYVYGVIICALISVGLLWNKKNDSDKFNNNIEIN